jgi:hypothetical protein
MSFNSIISNNSSIDFSNFSGFDQLLFMFSLIFFSLFDMISALLYLSSALLYLSLSLINFSFDSLSSLEN